MGKGIEKLIFGVIASPEKCWSTDVFGMLGFVS